MSLNDITTSFEQQDMLLLQNANFAAHNYHFDILPQLATNLH